MAKLNTTKRLPVLIGILLGVGLIAFAVIFIPQLINLNRSQQPASQIIVPNDTDTGNEAEGLLDIFEENQGLVDTFSCFYYPQASLKDFDILGQDGKSMYILLETSQDLSAVEKFYQDKKVQSIWSQAETYESSSLFREEQFIGQDSSRSAKYTYNSIQRDQVVNVLINAAQDQETEIMIIYWQL
ncbi:MAG: hypothetical protein PHN32_04990 [Actinomycetota bacterium]|nr:hypothetical protein [Actinomycetota bacterium]